MPDPLIHSFHNRLFGLNEDAFGFRYLINISLI